MRHCPLRSQMVMGWSLCFHDCALAQCSPRFMTRARVRARRARITETRAFFSHAFWGYSELRLSSGISRTQQQRKKKRQIEVFVFIYSRGNNEEWSAPCSQDPLPPQAHHPTSPPPPLTRSDSFLFVYSYLPGDHSVGQVRINKNKPAQKPTDSPPKLYYRMGAADCRWWPDCFHIVHFLNSGRSQARTSLRKRSRSG